MRLFGLVKLAFEDVGHLGRCRSLACRVGHADTRRLQFGKGLHRADRELVRHEEALGYGFAGILKLG